MRSEFISTTVVDGVALVLMRRPPVNAVNRQFLEELTAVFDALVVNDAVRVVILMGEGHVFCAGADLKDASFGLDAASDSARLRTANEAFFTIMDCKKPTIAAINGPALGAGVVLAASCDILIAAENAFFALPEVGVGLLGGGRHARRLFGHSLTRRMMLAGYRVSAAEMCRLGAVEKCVSPEKLLAEARQIASDIASSDPTVVQRAKRALNEVECMTVRDGYAHEQGLALDLLRTVRRAAKADVEERSSG